MFDIIENIPLLALRGLVIFPNVTCTFDVARPKSANALKAALDGGGQLFVITQKNLYAEEPLSEDLYKIGCMVRVKQVLKVSDSHIKVIVKGLYRARLDTLHTAPDFYRADVFPCEETAFNHREVYKESLLRRIRTQFHKYASLVPNLPPDIPATVDKLSNLSDLCDFIAFNISAPFDDKQFVLEQLSLTKRAKVVTELLDKEREINEIDKRIHEKTRAAIDENQREYYLKEQMKVLSNELYGDDSADEIEAYYDKIAKLDANMETKEKLSKAVLRLSKMPQGSHEGTVERNYLDTCIQLPWNAITPISTDIKRASKILERDIYGMQKVKERILELLSVYTLAPDLKGQIICLAGPPGVGKTSIGKSIAECMGRKYARISLGGIHDEAEIRGHRKTYIGSMPGKIINAISKVKSSNPLILLDEIDKLASDYKGDPSSALLEVLDPEQNNTFVDHYIDLPFDLSRAVFIATANNIDTIPAPLRDRMEIIEIGSYTREEKLNIAKRHLIPKQILAHGLKKSQIKFSDAAIYKIIDGYTREAGVRKLERKIAAICRKCAKQVASGEATRFSINLKDIENLLKKAPYSPEQILTSDEIGVINGLAWTAVGGTLMQLEVSVMKGTGKIELTGSLGDVMKESALAAVTFVRANAEKYSINPDFYKDNDIHIHATEAAVPKDGPSAGVTIATALVSALTSRPIKRDIAMTGEITITGRVLKIGGLKEKAMAAYSAGVKTVFIPFENFADLDEVDEIVKENVNFIPVKKAEEIIDKAILPIKEANWDIAVNVSKANALGQ